MVTGISSPTAFPPPSACGRLRGDVVPGLNTPGAKLNPITLPAELRVIFTGGAVPPANPPALIAAPTSVAKPAKLVSVIRPSASPLAGLFVV